MSGTPVKTDAPSADQPIARTPLADRTVAPGEVTVRFRRWHSMNNTAYQAGTFAGFPRGIAEDLYAHGLVDLAPDASTRREPAPNRMIRK